MRVLNFGLNRKIPFNKPHGFKILEVGEDHLTTYLPFKKANHNHIRGMHACALATLSEFTTGLSLLRKLNAQKYRIILKSLKMEYYYQGKSGVTANCAIDDAWLEEKILSPLKDNDSTTVMMEIECHDAKSNHISTGFIEWQVKDWEKVRTKVK
jgi:acyl-coenzyme A thioesterase PaaI-like protein